ncbi:DUF1217 domain-containing protein [Paracoccus sp. (in: a-proteobacteria)]|uniref:DUF1217 domain-containing protein n=1 Tax=Paracoccus sp. TaxID=267 RepID=UPI003A85136A
MINAGSGGLTGWRVLQRTEDRQMQMLKNDPVVQRETSYFRDRIEITGSAEALVGDYQMLTVALKAFGLEDDIGSRALIRQVLESDLNDNASLANRLSDKRYLRLARAFDFAGANNSEEPGFADRISQAYLERELERRVGASDETLRLALNARREIEDMAGRDSSDKTLWYEVFGNPPLRKVFQDAFGFGPAYGKLPIDRQLQEFTRASERVLGSASFDDITRPNVTDRLIQRFLLRSQMGASPVQNRYSAALTLLSQ